MVYEGRQGKRKCYLSSHKHRIRFYTQPPLPEKGPLSASHVDLGCIYTIIMLDLSLWLTLEAFQMENSKLEGGGNDKRKATEVGPWGGEGGASWDDGVHHGVREIKLVYGHCIDSISIVYDKNGKPVQSEKHGGLGGSNAAEVKLQFPDEVLVSISGHFCPMVHGGTPVIRSLMFKTNRRTFGPYGFEVGTPFFFPVEGGRIVGFKGRSGWYLDAIGFHVVQVPTTSLLQRMNKTFKRLASTAPKTSLSPRYRP